VSHTDSIKVFESGKEYPHFRIPSIIRTTKGTLLAFAEARQNLGDQAKNKIVVKRSEDNGLTWGPCQVVAEVKGVSLNNPCCVVEKKIGRIILIFQMYPKGVSEFRNITPNDIKDFEVHSDDDGYSWSSMREITQFTKYPQSLTMASGPGIGIQLNNPNFKNRIVIPYNHRIGFRWSVYCCYSDDGCQTWVRGECAKNDGIFSGGNEVQIVELSDGQLMLNCRHWGLRYKKNLCRRIAYSKDGGQTWSKLQREPRLIESQCMGSILRYSAKKPEFGTYMFFSNPATRVGRHTGTLYASFDEGKNWPFVKVVEPKYFAYSCLVDLADGNIGLLYETGINRLYESINFLKVDIQEIHNYLKRQLETTI
jgi:sialidase-1